MTVIAMRSDRADRILEVATASFERHGYARTRIEDVARQAGVTRATVHNHFGDKRGLFRRFVAETMSCALAEASACLEEDDTLWRRLEAAIYTWFVGPTASLDEERQLELAGSVAAHAADEYDASVQSFTELLIDALRRAEGSTLAPLATRGTSAAALAELLVMSARGLKADRRPQAFRLRVRLLLSLLQPSLTSSSGSDDA